MAGDDRKTFFGVLKREFASMLRADGFTGSGTTYRRAVGPVIQTIWIQSSRYGGECCVNLGVHLTFLPMVLDEAPDIRTITEPDCEFRCRLVCEGETDHWWPFGTTQDEAEMSVVDLVQTYRDYGAPYFAAWAEFPGRFIDLTVDQLTQGSKLPFPVHTTDLRAALAMARIHAHLGNLETSRSFAAFGLANLGKATGLRRSFEEMLTMNHEG
jgi:hypothetical protein